MTGDLLQDKLVHMESIHKRIKRLREAKGLTQTDLAEMVGVRYQSVQEWERENGTAPARKRMAAVAKVLGVTHQELHTGVTETAANAEAATDTDPRAKKVAALFFWLTEEQKAELLADVQSKAEGNRAIIKQLHSRLRPVSDQHVARTIKPSPIAGKPAAHHKVSKGK